LSIIGKLHVLSTFHVRRPSAIIIVGYSTYVTLINTTRARIIASVDRSGVIGSYRARKIQNTAFIVYVVSSFVVVVVVGKVGTGRVGNGGRPVMFQLVSRSAPSVTAVTPHRKRLVNYDVRSRCVHTRIHTRTRAH